MKEYLLILYIYSHLVVLLKEEKNKIIAFCILNKHISSTYLSCETYIFPIVHTNYLWKL